MVLSENPALAGSEFSNREHATTTTTTTMLGKTVFLRRWCVASFVMTLVVLIMIIQAENAFGFMAPPAGPQFASVGICIKSAAVQGRLNMISDNPFAEEKITKADVTLKDQTGNVFVVGGIIRVAKDNVKAYQVSTDGYGAFNDDKQFVKASEDSPRSSKNLVLPVGIRGVITKVYDTTEISSNFPIQVKFTPGENVDEGYDPPVPFTMHFSPREIECT